MNVKTWLRTLPFHLYSNPNTRLGFYLLGFLKLVRSQRELSINTITESCDVSSVAFHEIQFVERHLKIFFGEYRDGGASSSGIRARFRAWSEEVFKDEYLYSFSSSLFPSVFFLIDCVFASLVFNMCWIFCWNWFLKFVLIVFNQYWWYHVLSCLICRSNACLRFNFVLLLSFNFFFESCFVLGHVKCFVCHWFHRCVPKLCFVYCVFCHCSEYVLIPMRSFYVLCSSLIANRSLAIFSSSWF